MNNILSELRIHQTQIPDKLWAQHKLKKLSDLEKLGKEMDASQLSWTYSNTMPSPRAKYANFYKQKKLPAHLAESRSIF